MRLRQWPARARGNERRSTGAHRCPLVALHGQRTDDRLDPPLRYVMLQATERRIELELEDAERWMRSIDGQPVDVTTADRRDLVRVLQRTDVWAALLME